MVLPALLPADISKLQRHDFLDSRVEVAVKPPDPLQLIKAHQPGTKVFGRSPPLRRIVSNWRSPRRRSNSTQPAKRKTLALAHLFRQCPPPSPTARRKNTCPHAHIQAQRTTIHAISHLTTKSTQYQPCFSVFCCSSPRPIHETLHFVPPNHGSPHPPSSSRFPLTPPNAADTWLTSYRACPRHPE